MTIRQAIHWARNELGQTSSSPGLDAEMLLSEVLKCNFAFLLAHDDQGLTKEQEKNYQTLIHKRREGMPVSYLLGKKEFYGLEFKVREGVLVPRPDTEILVEMVLNFLKSQIQNSKFQKGRGHSESVPADEESRRSSSSPHPFPSVSSERQSFLEFKLVDVGTGSGCIPIAVLKNYADLKGVGLELSPKALKIAQKNAKKLGVSDRLQLVESDLLENLPKEGMGNQPWILVGNLPYLPDDWPQHFSTQFEPDLALFGGKRGVHLYQRLAQQIEKLKDKPEALFFECFTFQVKEIEGVLPSYRLMEVKKMTGEACGISFAPLIK